MSGISQIEGKENITDKLQDASWSFDDLQQSHQEDNERKIQSEENNKQPSKTQNRFKEVKFSGLTDSQNPKGFIQTFEKIADEVNLNESEKQYYFTESLVDEATSWIKTRRFETYKEMRKDFLNFYWSPNKQLSFLDHLDVGKYDPNCGLSMTEYFLKYFNASKFLDTVCVEECVILDLLQHFDFKEEVQAAFKVKSVQTLEEALDTLKKVEAWKSSGQEEIKSTTAPKISLIRFFGTILILFVLLLRLTVFISNSTSSTVLPANVNSEQNHQSNIIILDRYNCQKLIPFDLKFSGRKNSIHPINFVQNFEHMAAQNNFDAHSKKNYFIGSLVGEAQDWLHIRGYGTYEYMKEGLLDFFWSPVIQDMFLDYLKYGKYDEKSGLSVSEYFHKYINESKFLDNAPYEEEVISVLLNHFDLITAAKKALKIRPVKSIEEALSFLDRYHYVLDHEKMFLHSLVFAILILIIFVQSRRFLKMLNFV